MMLMLFILMKHNTTLEQLIKLPELRGKAKVHILNLIYLSYLQFSKFEYEVKTAMKEQKYFHEKIHAVSTFRGN